MITISLIASGKLSYNLSKVFSNNENFRIIEIYSRKKKKILIYSMNKLNSQIKLKILKRLIFILYYVTMIQLKKLAKK